MSNLKSDDHDDYKFLRIIDAIASINQKVNLIGVITEIGIFKQSRGTDCCCTIKIVDESSASSGISVNFFAENFEKLPHVESHGDIIQLVRVVMKSHLSGVNVLYHKRFSSFALYEGREGSKFAPYQVSSRFQARDRDKKFIAGLRKWTASHQPETGENMFKLFDRFITKVGPESVIQIITDSASNNVRAGKLVEEKYPYIYWTPCAAHCIDLIFEDIFKLPHLKRTLERAIAVNTYIYNRTLLLNMMGEFTDNKEMVRPAKTRFATAFITLSCFKENKKNLRKMFISEQWSKSKFAKEAGGKQTAYTIMLPSFWKNVNIAVKVGYPLLDVLRLVDGERKPPMGYIYEAMDRAKELIAKSFNNNEGDYQRIFEIIDRRWDCQLHRPLHAAEYYLNPSLYYNNPAVEDDSEVVGGFMECVSKLTLNEEEQMTIHAELPLYCGAEGLFGNPMAQKMRASLAPASSDSLSLKDIKQGYQSNLICKVLHICEVKDGEWMLFVWDGTDAPPLNIHTKLDEEFENPLPLQLEEIPLSRTVLCKFPTVGTVLRMTNDTCKEKLGLHVLKAGKWVQFRNIDLEVRSGLWCGILLSKSKFSFLPDDDDYTSQCQRKNDERVKSKWDRKPFTCFPWPSKITDSDYQDVPFVTLMDILTYPEVIAKFRCVVRVVATVPGHPRDFKAPSGIYRLRLTLEDPTTRIHAYLYAEDGVKFFGGHPSVDTMIKMHNALLGVEETDAADSNEKPRNPPWVECCLNSYNIDETDVWGSVRYRIFATTLVG